MRLVCKKWKELTQTDITLREKICKIPCLLDMNTISSALESIDQNLKYYGRDIYLITPVFRTLGLSSDNERILIFLEKNKEQEYDFCNFLKYLERTSNKQIRQFAGNTLKLNPSRVPLYDEENRRSEKDWTELPLIGIRMRFMIRIVSHTNGLVLFTNQMKYYRKKEKCYI